MVSGRPTGLALRDLPGDPDLALVTVGAHLAPYDVVPGPVRLADPFDDPTGPFVQVEARVRQREYQTSARVEEPGRLPDRSLSVRHVLERHVGDDEIERSIRKVAEMGCIPFQEPGPRATDLLAPSGKLEGPAGPVDPDHRLGPLSGPTTGKIAVAAPEVEDASASHRADDPDQRGVNDRTVPEVAALSHPDIAPCGERIPAFACHARAGRPVHRKEGALYVDVGARSDLNDDARAGSLGDRHAARRGRVARRPRGLPSARLRTGAAGNVRRPDPLLSCLGPSAVTSTPSVCSSLGAVGGPRDRPGHEAKDAAGQHLLSLARSDPSGPRSPSGAGRSDQARFCAADPVAHRTSGRERCPGKRSVNTNPSRSTVAPVRHGIGWENIGPAQANV